MQQQPPKFNYRAVSKWRSVDLSTTKYIAELCSSGVSFTGCSKALIFESMAQPCGHSSNAPKFLELMDAAAKFMPKLTTEFNKKVSDKINEALYAYNQKQP